ncbi:MAG: ribosomal protein S18-alanine N-acetyltransferase [Pseudomonadota bacterium]|jgi:ribosomal-protein-alanine N-acetyltransferase
MTDKMGSEAQHLLLSRLDAGATVATIEIMRGVDDAEILHIETLPSHRRQGLAQSLLTEAFDWARQHQRQAVWLEVRAGNDAAVSLYRKTGFVQISTRKRYYADGEDALVMKYTL